MATWPGRGVIAAGMASALLVGGCTGATPSPSVTPSVSTSPTPSPTPSRTYGPNQTAALATVTGYYTWWNTARKNPMDPRFQDLERYMDVAAQASASSMGDIAGLATLGYRQVGDMVLTDISTEPESASKITVAMCVDRTQTSLVNSEGRTVDPRDRQTGATIPAAQVFTRRVYAAVTKPNASGTWVVTDLTGGTASC